MAVIYTIRAECDWPEGCDEEILLSSGSTQIYLDLTRAGWRNVVEGTELLTYCPNHPRGTES